MSKKGEQSKPQRPQAPRFNGVEFVQYELSKEEKLDLRNNFLEGLDLFTKINDLIEDGYGVSLKYDAYGDCQACFIKGDGPKPKNPNKVLTGRGRTAAGAFVEALYKHERVFEGLWPDRNPRNSVELWEDMG